MPRLHRRTVLAGALGAAAAALCPAAISGRQARTRLVLLGTGGGPRPTKNVSAPAQAVVVDGAVYVVDCGDGVARQLVAAGLPLPSLRHVFVTHHHSDHNADYGNLLLLAWAAGLRTAVDTWGPPPLERMTRQFLELNDADITTRIADEGRVPLAPLVRAHDVAKAGVVMQDDRVKVTAAVVPHPPVTPSFAYRFDTADRSIVISGDTARSDALVELARGADVLVHEALYLPAVDRIVGSIPNASTLKQHLIDSHTTAEDCGRVAQAAGVKTLVLSHFVPADDPLVTDEMWIAAARTHFRGTVVIGKDLMAL
jgi:ribonuclease BN (tRNA processing enzyme)